MGAGRVPTAETQQLLDLLTELLSSTFRQILWQRAVEIELTYSQSQVLFHVDQQPGCNMGEVARKFGVSLAAVTQIVDRLEQKKFLTRGSHPTDRRVCLLNLTPDGRELVTELRMLQTAGLAGVLSKMSSQDRRRLVRGLEALVQASRATDASQWAPRSGRRPGPRKGNHE